jgi:hypothetical protein
MYNLIHKEFNAMIECLGDYNLVDETNQQMLLPSVGLVHLKYRNKYVFINIFFSIDHAIKKMQRVFQGYIWGIEYKLADLDKFSELNFGTESLKCFSLDYYEGSTEEKVKAVAEFFAKLLSHQELQPMYRGEYSWSNKYIKSTWEGTDR